MSADDKSRGSGSGSGSGANRTPFATTKAAPQQPARSSRPWFPTPAPVRRLFARFPLQTLPSEALPACPHDTEPSSASSPYDNDDDDEELPVLHIFSDPTSARRGAPSFNPLCLQHQAWLRVHGVATRCVSSSNHAAPDGALPFVMPARRRGHARTQHAAVHENGKTREKEAASTDGGGENAESAGVAAVTITEGLGILGATQTSGAMADAHDKPIPSAKLWTWASAQQKEHGHKTHSHKHGSKTHTHKHHGSSSLQRARETAYLAMVEQRLRAAWLLAVYLTPANFHIAESLYIHPNTSSPLVHALQAASLTRAAREALHTLSPPTASSRLVQSSATRPLTLLPSTVRSSLPAALVSSQFPTEDDAQRIYAAADEALDSLAALLGDDALFFGAARPGRLDVAVFSYMHLMIGHPRLEGEWADTRLRDVGQSKANGHGKLHDHWRRMLRELDWD